MNGRNTYHEESHRRPYFALWLFGLLLLAACKPEQSVAPRSGVLRPPTVATKTVAVGDEVLVWASWSIAEGSEIDVIITRRYELHGPVFCPPFVNEYDATIQEKYVGGNTRFPGAEKLLIEEVLRPGTRLRFDRWVTSCGAANGYAFDVISVPGTQP